jgi:2-C-methyl-D-erythritol 4-phosphate cytidylyltransferase/2-C-methyl-D-erythritol 2,4-cyclodiphosphate synthase
MNAAIVVAAGRGHRMGGPIPKQYRELNGLPVLRHTLLAFLRHPHIALVQAVIHPSDRELYDKATHGLDLPPPVIGGATRQESVRFGLESIAGQNPRKVIIHDGVRPFVEQQTITDVLAALDDAPAVITGVPVVDTLKRCPGGQVSATVDRADVWRAQTPQGFLFDRILAAHQKLHLRDPNSSDLTDDALVAESDNMPVVMSFGSEDNIKITTERDLERAEQILVRGRQETHTGFGFDFQRLGAGDQVFLCGIPVPHVMGIERDYTADIALNAVTEALTGTVGGPDVPGRFQPHLPRWRGMSSDVFVRHAVSLVAMKGGRIVHVDVTVLSSRPDIEPYRQAMLQRLATLLDVPSARISIKQTEATDVSFSDRADAVGAQCLATVQYPAL